MVRDPGGPLPLSSPAQYRNPDRPRGPGDAFGLPLPNPPRSVPMRARWCFVPGLAVLAALCSAGPAVSDDPKARAAVSVTATDEKIDFKDARGLVTTYHIGPKVAKPYFWPLNAPCGEPVTRAWPMAD